MVILLEGILLHLIASYASYAIRCSGKDEKVDVAKATLKTSDKRYKSSQVSINKVR